MHVRIDGGRVQGNWRAAALEAPPGDRRELARKPALRGRRRPRGADRHALDADRGWLQPGDAAIGATGPQQRAGRRGGGVQRVAREPDLHLRARERPRGGPEEPRSPAAGEPARGHDRISDLPGGRYEGVRGLPRPAPAHEPPLVVSRLRHRVRVDRPRARDPPRHRPPGRHGGLRPALGPRDPTSADRRRDRRLCRLLHPRRGICGGVADLHADRRPDATTARSSWSASRC